MNLLIVLPTVMILLAGCEQSEVERLASGSDDKDISGKLATLTISLQGIPEYNAPDGETRAAGSREPLIGEWVKVNTFDATCPVEKSGKVASDDESAGPRIALMELREDTVSGRPATRGVMDAGIYFRLIAFRKSGDNYVFQSAADYTSNGSSAPVLQQGQMILPINQVYRFVAYSFNNNTSLGTLPPDCTWNSTQIPIPNLYNDFLTYDSGDQTPSGESLTLAVRFTHQLCQLTVRINPINFDNNTFTNCTGVYISQGGNSSSWIVGQDGIAANTNNSAPFNINDNSTAIVRLVPSAYLRAIAVYFGTLTIDGIAANNLTMNSSQSVQLVRGRSYTLTMNIKYNPPGIKLSASEITLTGNGCTQQDKDDLSKLRWAEGNLKSTGNGSVNDYVWTTSTDYGYYYTFYSTYTGNTSINGIDPCDKLNPSIYGSGWRTPSSKELIKLSRCTNNQMVSNGGVTGMWFMNIPKGVFLPASGIRLTDGSGMEPSGLSGNRGNYWTSTEVPSTVPEYHYGHALIIESGKTRDGVFSASGGYSVRCVRGKKQ